MEEKEEAWFLKRREIWLQGGDRNTKFFQDYAWGRKITNTIWELKNWEGVTIWSFEGLAKLGMDHFQDMFKALGGASIAKIIHIYQLFPRFVEHEDN